jgi:hypothetical protein
VKKKGADDVPVLPKPHGMFLFGVVQLLGLQKALSTVPELSSVVVGLRMVGGCDVEQLCTRTRLFGSWLFRIQHGVLVWLFRIHHATLQPLSRLSRLIFILSEESHSYHASS